MSAPAPTPDRPPPTAPPEAGDVLDALAPTAPDRTRLLARPAARRVADALRAAPPQGLTAEDLARTLGVHHTAVRAQLGALRRSGVVEVWADPPAGRGRPAHRYRLAPDPAEREAAGHRELVRLLMELVGRAGFDAGDVLRFGELQGRGIARPGAGPEEIRDAFARLGFAPHRDGDDAVPDLVLHRCPFADGVEAPGGRLICELHHGLARGIAATAAPEVRVDDLVVVDPRTAGCRLRMSAREEAAE